MDPTQITSLVQADPAANSANELLTDAGGTVYVVGGAVRDLALGKAPKDIDLMVTGLTGEAIEAALKGHGRIDFTGKAFGVYRFRTNNSEVEIAMPRVEYGDTNTDYNVDPNIPIEQDLLRRDFTANAMAVNPNTGELVDPYGGVNDLATKTLALANPGGFTDDPTRLLRAITAYSKSGLYPDATTFAAMKNEAHKLESQPAERIQGELDKLLAGSNPSGAMQLASDTGLLKVILPEVSSAMGFDQMNPHHDLDVGSHLLACLQAMTKLSNDPDLRMAALLHDIGKPDSFWLDASAPQGGGGHFYKKILEDGTELGENHEELGADYAKTRLGENGLKYPNARIDRIEKLIRWHMFPYFNNMRGARRFFAMVGGDPKMAFDLLTLREADASAKSTGIPSDKDEQMIRKDRELLQQVIEQQEAVTRKDLKINGTDLLNLGFQPGPELGTVLDKLLDVVIENPELNTREELLRLAQGFLAKTSAEKPWYQLSDGHEIRSLDDGTPIRRNDAELLNELPGSDIGNSKLYNSIAFKWAYTEQGELDVWPVRNGSPDHFTRRGPDSYYTEAQGWIMKDGRVTIHLGYVDPELEERGWETAVDWAIANNVAIIRSAAKDPDEFSDEIYNLVNHGNPSGSSWDYLRQLDHPDDQEGDPDYNANREFNHTTSEAWQKLIAELPHYKWSWNGYELDVWPTRDWNAEDHFERTGILFREFAQGRIYIDPDGYLELFVWENRGTEKEREKAVEAVEEWMLHNLGRMSDIVTYEGEYMPTAPKDNLAPGQLSVTDPNDFFADHGMTIEPREEDYGNQERSIHDFTDEEWERMERDGRVFR